LAVTTSHDDGFREIQLSGKQLVFLFMAVTVVLIVTFLTGVLVGRGVRAERAESAQADVLTETPPVPARTPGPTIEGVGADPRAAAPPAPAGDDASADRKQATASEPAEEPPVAVKRQTAAEAAAGSPAKPADAAPRVSAAPAAVSSAGKQPTISAAAPPAESAPAAPATAAPETGQRNGYAVQVAAVNARSEADAIVKRLSGKGYAAYVEVPKGSTSMYRVRVGTFKTRSEAQTVADKLKKEEKFKPWVTR
jgi:cell division septation protein DedD